MPRFGGVLLREYIMSPAKIKELRDRTGCSLKTCKEALEYAEERKGGFQMAIAYCKAKSLAVKTNCSFDERVQRFLENM